MSWLEAVGAEALRKEALAHLRRLTNEVKTHISTELEKHMAPIHESIDRLASAFATELQQVRDAAQANLDAANAALAEANEDNTELTNALQAQVAANEALVADIDSAKSRLDDMSAGYEANDPQPEPPVEEPPVEEPPVEEPPVEEPPVDTPEDTDTSEPTP